MNEAVLIRPRRLSFRLRRTHRRSRRTLTLGCVLLGSLLLASLVGPLLLVDPSKQDLANTLVPPGTSDHLLGTDRLGRDVLAWILASIRVAFKIALAVVLLSAFVGTVVGITAGYIRGAVDGLLMRFVDLQLAIPPILLFIAASAVIRPSTTNLILLLSCVAWVPYARLVRSKILSERERGYVSAARLAGASRRRVVLLLAPSVIPIVVVFASLQVGYVLLWEAGLSFLGLGVKPPDCSLGLLIAQGKEYLTSAWWLLTFPGVVLVLLVLAFAMIGDGLRDIFDVNDTDEYRREH